MFHILHVLKTFVCLFVFIQKWWCDGLRCCIGTSVSSFSNPIHTDADATQPSCHFGVGDMYWVADCSWRQSWRVWTTSSTTKLSRVVSAVWTHPSAVVTRDARNYCKKFHKNFKKILTYFKTPSLKYFMKFLIFIIKWLKTFKNTIKVYEVSRKYIILFMHSNRYLPLTGLLTLLQWTIQPAPIVHREISYSRIAIVITA